MVLIGLVFLLIQTSFVQNLAKDKVVSLLQKKIKTEISIENLNVDFPKRIVLEGVYLEDQSGDTMLAGDTIKVDISLLKLLSRQIEINEIDLRGITAFIKHTLPDSAYNFDYILKSFVREETGLPDTTAGMQFSVSKINLDRINVKMNDEVTGNDISFYIRHFDTRIDKFDLEKKKFTIPKITLSGLDARLRQTKALSRETVTTDTLNMSMPITYPDVELGEIDISDINIDYANTVTAIESKLALGSLLVEFDKLDLPNQQIDVRLVKLENTQGIFALGETAQDAVVATATEVAKVMEKGWTIKLSKLGLDGIDFKYDDLTLKPIARGMDYGHIGLTDLFADAEDLFYNSDTLYGKINELKLNDKSGVELNRLSGDFFYGHNSLGLENYTIETPRSHISDQLQLSYPSIDSISKDPGVLGINGHFANSRLAVQDLLLFAPSLAQQDPFQKNQNAIIHLNGDVAGRVGDLRFSDLEISGLGNIRIRATGSIAGLPDANKLYANLQFDHLSASETDLMDILPPGTIPSSIRIPDQFTLRGTFKGGITSFTTNMNMNSSFGSAYVNATLKNMSIKGRESYDAKISTSQFNLGKLIRKEDILGNVSFSGNIVGNGTDPKTATATFDGDIREVHYNEYTYHNLSVKGKANKGDIEVDAKALDPNISLDLHAIANMNGQYPKLNLTMNVDSINLQKLNLYEKDFRFQGQVNADLETADPDYLNGTIEIANAVIAVPGRRYRLDTISVVSVATAGEDSISLRSEFLSVDMKGQYNLTQIFPAVQGTINKYFNTIPGPVTAVKYEPQQVKFSARLIRSPLIEDIVPDLKEMEDLNLTGSFDSQTGDIVVTGGIPRLRYKDYTVSNLVLDLHTANDALNYAFTFDQLSSLQLQILNTSLSGKAQNNILGIDLLVKNAAEKNQYRIAGELTSANSLFEFKLLPDGLLLNYQPWTVAQDNAIQFGSDGLMFRNFNISNGGQSMVINSTPQVLDAPLDLKFSDFKIETITRLITKDSLLAGGMINGTAFIRDLKTNLVFTSDLTIKDFSFHGDTVGDIALKVNNEKADTYAADVKITGYGNEVSMNGFYFVSGDQSNYDLNVDIVTLNMSSIEGFTMGQIDDASGILTGDLSIKGTLAAPKILGDVRFKEVGFKLTRFNSYYTIQDEAIKFTSDGIGLDNFTIVDTEGNQASLEGNIYTRDYRDYRFDLDLQSDNFQVMNSTKENNKLYYGQLFVDALVHIKGGLGNPVIDGSIRVNEKTKLTVVVPQSDPGIVEREGIVEFVDMDTFQITLIAPPPLDSLNRSQLIGMDVAVDISVDKEAELNLIIDEANGDYLNIKGAANLTGGIDPSGKVTLTGIYELDQGSYSFSFNQLKREFLIKEGSTISWSGEPLEADVNVTAIYIAETAPLSLVQNQLADAEQNVINIYKQKLPFQVLLTMKGKLLKPEITFDIELPDKNYSVSREVTNTVQSRLAQLRTEPSELNKQVFAVLLLNRFISENPFQNEARGGGISSLARQSASKLLSEQLNNLVGGLIAGIDLSFDINSIEDYTSGELQNRTDLTVGLSKQLLDDRLKVSIGSNFELEGPQEANRKTTNIAGDVSAEYQLTKDGRYLLRAYRKNEYIIVQGQVVETGLGFVFTADYDQLKDLFGKKTQEEKLHKHEEREARKEERQEPDEN